MHHKNMVPQKLWSHIGDNILRQSYFLIIKKSMYRQSLWTLEKWLNKKIWLFYNQQFKQKNKKYFFGDFWPLYWAWKTFYDNFQKFLSCSKKYWCTEIQNWKKKDRNELLEKSKITVIFQDAQIFNVWKAFLNIR